MRAVHVLRGVIASGQRLVAGTEATISEADARTLIASGKVVLTPVAPAQLEEAFALPPPEGLPARERATKSRRSKAVLP